MIFKEIVKKIKEYDTIIIHRHQRPDGDCIGSQMGLKYTLQESFPEKKIYAVGDDIPKYLAFLGEDDKIDDSIYSSALVIVVDTSIRERIYDERWQLGKYIIKIDHHDDSEDYGNLQYVDNKSAACANIITEFLRSDKIFKINIQAASALYTGIVTDTGRFMFRGVNGNVMLSAAYLLNLGIDIEKIYSELNVKSIESFRLQGYVYNHIKTTPSGVCYIYFTEKIMEKYGTTRDEAAALVNSLSNIAGSLIWVTFVDYGDNIRVRIRSRYVAINEVATHYRGGGHLLASGATVYNTKEMKELLNELDLVHLEYKYNNPGAK